MSTVGVFLVHSDSCIAYVNKKACTMLGYSQEELLSQLLFQIYIDLLYYEKWLKCWQRIKKCRFSNTESFYQPKNGLFYPVEVNANYLQLDSDEYLFVCVRDIRLFIIKNLPIEVRSNLDESKTGGSILEYARPSRGTQIINKITNK
ncbi:MAG: PAS domain S-box protein [Richelia sp.]|nr:PAS domain S-box protein [Richelia sp.]CDN13228.1 transcriptional regulator [Richelia intracellularis]